MFRSFRSVLAAGAVVAILAAGAPAAVAQSPGTDSAAPKKTFRQSAQEKREQLEQQESRKRAHIKAKLEADRRAAQVMHRKRIACGKRAKAQHLHLMKRHRFMKKCMAES